MESSVRLRGSFRQSAALAAPIGIGGKRKKKEKKFLKKAEPVQKDEILEVSECRRISPINEWYQEKVGVKVRLSEGVVHRWCKLRLDPQKSELEAKRKRAANKKLAFLR